MKNPHLVSFLSRPKAAALKHAAFLVGLPSTGTKAALQDSMYDQLADEKNRLYGGRVLSIDMGIRNLAYCVIDVPQVPTPQFAPAKGFTQYGPSKVIAWTKQDLLRPTDAIETTPAKMKDTTNPESNPRKAKPTAHRSQIPKDAFTPSHLSHTAYTITQHLLYHNPTHVLIERQRFRSGGAAAIQEWTVRVNMLESMLWACLRTMQAQKQAGSLVEVCEVSPARVAGFWVAGRDVRLRVPQGALAGESGWADMAAPVEKAGRTRVQKKDKIAIVRSWLDSESKGGDDRGNAFDLVLQGEAATVAESFRKESGSARRKEGDAAPVEGKLDDLADCLLQAAAWLRWEENTLVLQDACETYAEKWRSENLGDY